MPVPSPRPAAESNITQPKQSDLLLSLPDEVLDALLWEYLLVVLLLASLDQNQTGYKPCKVVTAADKVPDSHKPAYWELVNTPYSDGGLSAHDTCAKLAKAGIFLGTATVDRHRKRTCRCPKP